MQPTPRMSEHARQRCRDMGISTKVAKRIVQHPAITHCAKEGRVLVTSDKHPEYAVVYAPSDPPVIVTVLFNTQVRYERQGATWRELETQEPTAC